MDGTTQTQSQTLGLGLILAVIVICFIAMGQDRTKIGLLPTDPQWVAIPHESGNIVYYIRTDRVVAIVEALSDELVERGSFSRTELILANGKSVRTSLKMEDVARVIELSKPTAKAAREAYLSSEKKGDK